MSYRVAIKTRDDVEWVHNGIRFVTQDEADDYRIDIRWRWRAITEWEVQEAQEPATHEWVTRVGIVKLKES